MSSLVTNLNSSTAQEILNWVTTVFTAPTRLNSTVESRRRQRCVSGITRELNKLARDTRITCVKRLQ